MTEIVHRTIKIAPGNDEMIVEGNTISTTFAGGIKYKAEGLQNYNEDFIKGAFATAIALACKRWQLEEMLNNALHLDGCVE